VRGSPLRNIRSGAETASNACDETGSHLHAIGQQLAEACQLAVSNAGLETRLQVVPCPWMVTFLFRNEEGEASSGLRTLFMQEMIRRGVLFQGIFVPCFSHTPSDVVQFVEAFVGSLEVYARAVREGYQTLLVGEPAKPVFRKYL
jgi:spore coat polysaccharide biosynthesis protein SpsF